MTAVQQRVVTIQVPRELGDTEIKAKCEVHGDVKLRTTSHSAFFRRRLERRDQPQSAGQRTAARASVRCETRKKREIKTQLFLSITELYLHACTCACVRTRVFSLLLLQRENIWPLAPEVSFFISAVPFCVKYIYKGR